MNFVQEDPLSWIVIFVMVIFALVSMVAGWRRRSPRLATICAIAPLFLGGALAILCLQGSWESLDTQAIDGSSTVISGLARAVVVLVSGLVCSGIAIPLAIPKSR